MAGVISSICYWTGNQFRSIIINKKFINKSYSYPANSGTEFIYLYFILNVRMINFL